jgi:hypothetical protein
MFENFFNNNIIKILKKNYKFILIILLTFIFFYNKKKKENFSPQEALDGVKMISKTINSIFTNITDTQVNLDKKLVSSKEINAEGINGKTINGTTINGTTINGTTINGTTINIPKEGRIKVNNTGFHLIVVKNTTPNNHNGEFPIYNKDGGAYSTRDWVLLHVGMDLDWRQKEHVAGGIAAFCYESGPIWKLKSVVEFSQSEARHRILCIPMQYFDPNMTDKQFFTWQK